MRLASAAVAHEVPERAAAAVQDRVGRSNTWPSWEDADDYWFKESRTRLLVNELKRWWY